MNQDNLIREHVATQSINADTQSVAEVLGLADTAYSGTVINEVWYDVMDNVASNLTQKDVVLTDIFHEMDGDTLSGYIGMMYGAAQKRAEDGKLVSEHIKHIEGQAYKALEQLTADICRLRGGEPSEGQRDLADAASVMVQKRLIVPSFWGGKSEMVSGNTLQEEEGVEWIAHSDIIADATGYENPEARGIDMLLKWPDGEMRTAQVKYGPGGEMPETCKADLLLRYEEPNKDNNLINPVVRMYDIPAEK